MDRQHGDRDPAADRFHGDLHYLTRLSGSFMRTCMSIFFLVALAACAGNDREVSLNASSNVPVETAYVASDAPKLSLITVVNNTTGAGGHSALLISGSEQIIFDPAGSFRHPDIVEAGDVLYGVTPRWLQAYKSAHARASHHVVRQDLAVTPAQAERALQLARENGRVADAFCTNSITRLLRQVPGFEGIDVTFFPKNLMDQVAARPDVISTERYFEDDAGHVTDGIVPAGT
jgi:hypothetical protein